MSQITSSTTAQAPAAVTETSFDELVGSLDVLNGHPNNRFAGVGRSHRGRSPMSAAEVRPAAVQVTYEQMRAIVFERAKAEQDRAERRSAGS